MHEELRVSWYYIREASTETGATHFTKGAKVALARPKLDAPNGLVSKWPSPSCFGFPVVFLLRL